MVRDPPRCTHQGFSCRVEKFFLYFNWLFVGAAAVLLGLVEGLISSIPAEIRPCREGEKQGEREREQASNQAPRTRACLGPGTRDLCAFAPHTTGATDRRQEPIVVWKLIVKIEL